LFFDIESNRNRTVDVVIYSNDGRFIKKEKIELVSGRNTDLFIDLNNLSSGHYFVRFLEGGNFVGSKKFVID